MTRKLDSLSAAKEVDVFLIKRLAEGIAVKRLAPLGVRSGMAVAAILCVGESAWLDEFAAFGLGVAREKWRVLAEAEVVGLTDLSGVLLALCAEIAADGNGEYQGAEKGEARQESNGGLQDGRPCD
jgi:hypothetical protein